MWFVLLSENGSDAVLWRVQVCKIRPVQDSGFYRFFYIIESCLGRCPSFMDIWYEKWKWGSRRRIDCFQHWQRKHFWKRILLTVWVTLLVCVFVCVCVYYSILTFFSFLIFQKMQSHQNWNSSSTWTTPISTMSSLRTLSPLRSASNKRVRFTRCQEPDNEAELWLFSFHSVEINRCIIAV